MAPAASTASSTTSNVPDGSLSLSLTGAGTASYGDFRDDLARDGYAVVKGAVPREQALAVADKIYKYLEDLYVTSLDL
jgi:hypothetical protein